MEFKLRAERVFVCWNDTGLPLRKRDGSGPAVMREVEAVKWCNKRKWKVRGKGVHLAIAIVQTRRVVGTNMQTIRYMEPDE